MSTIRMEFDIDIDDLTCDICDRLNHEQAIKLIKDIDIYQQNWDFTLKIYDHFKKLKDEYDQEVKDYE